MKTVVYQDEVLATNTDAYQLLLQWQRSGRAEDKAKLDAHLKQINLNYKKLYGFQ